MKKSNKVQLLERALCNAILLVYPVPVERTAALDYLNKHDAIKCYCYVCFEESTITFNYLNVWRIAILLVYPVPVERRSDVQLPELT